jgi:hypothetical protein
LATFSFEDYKHTNYVSLAVLLKNQGPEKFFFKKRAGQDFSHSAFWKKDGPSPGKSTTFLGRGFPF